MKEALGKKGEHIAQAMKTAENGWKDWETHRKLKKQQK